MKREEAREASPHSRSENPPTQSALKDELKEMVKRDQEARRAFFSSQNKSTYTQLAATDAADLTRLKKIVAEFGFPTLAMVGRDGVQNAWLLTQHADSDVAFQKQILTTLQARPDSEVPAREIAMLSDRIRIHEGKRQLYGSNFDLKTMEPTPIEDPAHVDERRAKVHLMPMADYRCVMLQIYRARR